MQERKDELRKEHDQKLAQQTFNERVTTLIAALESQGVQYENQPQITTKTWIDQMQDLDKLIANRDDALWTKAVPVLLELQIPQFWVLGRFNCASQESLWQYVQVLHKYARVCHPMTCIASPGPAPESFDELQALGKSMAQKMFTPGEMEQMSKRFEANPEFMSSMIENMPMLSHMMQNMTRILPRK